MTFSLNRNSLIAFVIILFHGFYSNAQALQWVDHWGGEHNDGFSQIEYFDNEIYAGGTFTGTFSVNGLTTVSSTQFDDIFFTKYNQNGQLSWIKTIAGASGNILTDLKVDSQGNIILFGRFSGVLDFDPSSNVLNLTSASSNDLFFVKYSNNGSLLWAKNLSAEIGGSSFFGKSLAIDNFDNIYLAGELIGIIDFDPGPNSYLLNTSFGGPSGFFAKYSPQGDFIWAKNFEGGLNSYSQIYSINVANNNQIYISGNFINSVDFDPSSNQNNATSTINDYDAFFSSYSANGDFLWVKKFGNSGVEHALQIKSDNNGFLYISGTVTSNNIDFDPSSNVASLNNNGFFIAKYTTSGDFNWVTNASGVKFDLSSAGILTGGGVEIVQQQDFIIDSQNFSRISNNGVTVWEKSAGYNISDIKDLGSSIYLSGFIFSPSDVDPGYGVQIVLLNGPINGQKDACLTSYFDCSTESPVNSLFVSATNVFCYGDSTGSAVIQGAGGVPPYSYLLSNGQEDSSATNLNSGYYIGVVYDTNLCEDTSMIEIQQPDFVPATICLVTVDSLSQNNIIVWDKSVFINQPIDSFIIHREVQTNVYLPLGSVSINDLSQFVDTFRTLYFMSPYWSLGDPNSGTYRYKLQWKDSCGNLSPLSDFHNTIFMTDINGTFSWPQFYTIENGSNPVIQYLLLRDNFNNGAWQVVNSVSGTQQSITDPAYASWAATANYKVITQWNFTCTSTQINEDSNLVLKSDSYISSQSNTLRPVLGMDDNIIKPIVSFHPNPTNDKITLNISDCLINEKYFIRDNSGRIVKNGILTKTTESIDLSNLTNGIYFMNSDVIYIQQIIIKQ